MAKEITLQLTSQEEFILSKMFEEKWTYLINELENIVEYKEMGIVNPNELHERELQLEGQKETLNNLAKKLQEQRINV
tara:strand:- start:522 stop:755 length:234 start_codon:yes stop_codon:yes gene_type:complete